MPDSRFNFGHPAGKSSATRARTRAAAPVEAGAEAEAAAPESQTEKVASFEALFGQRFQATKLSESDTLARLAGQAIGRLPGLDAKGALASQVATGRLDQEGVRLLQEALKANGAKLEADGRYGPKTHAALSKALKSAPAARTGRTPKAKPVAQPNSGLTLPGGKPKPAPERAPKPAPERGEVATKPSRQAPKPVEAGGDSGSVSGQGGSLGNLHLRRTSGRATTFANGHIPYKGWVDVHNKQNRGIGAWGDKCAPTDYFCALPESLGLSVAAAKAWHNKKILVTNPENGKQVVVRIQDKGPHGSTGAAIDLSPVAMEALGGTVGGSMGRVNFQFANQDAPVGPVR